MLLKTTKNSKVLIWKRKKSILTTSFWQFLPRLGGICRIHFSHEKITGLTFDYIGCLIGMFTMVHWKTHIIGYYFIPYPKQPGTLFSIAHLKMIICSIFWGENLGEGEGDITWSAWEIIYCFFWSTGQKNVLLKKAKLVGAFNPSEKY